MRARAVLLVVALASGSAALWAIRRGGPAAPAGASEAAPSPGDCAAPDRCAPGCYRGKRYCLRVCTASLGRNSCTNRCGGEEVCAPPDYDPAAAYAALGSEERRRVRIPSLFGEPRRGPAERSESLHPKLRRGEPGP